MVIRLFIVDRRRHRKNQLVSGCLPKRLGFR